MAIVVQLVVGELQLVEGDDLLHPLRALDQHCHDDDDDHCHRQGHQNMMEKQSVTFAGESGWTWILGGELGSALPATTQLEVWNAYLGNAVGKLGKDTHNQTVNISTCIFYHQRGQSP